MSIFGSLGIYCKDKKFLCLAICSLVFNFIFIVGIFLLHFTLFKYHSEIESSVDKLSNTTISSSHIRCKCPESCHLLHATNDMKTGN